MLTHKRLTYLLSYNRLTGVFRWKVSRQGLNAGEVAGSIHKVNGYVYLFVDGVRYRAHRLAWFYVNKKWANVDHKDRVRHHNWIDNLREASKSQNECNKGITSKNKSGYKGVSWNATRNKYYAVISLNKKYMHIGVFDCPIEAAHAYDDKARALHGAFAVTNESLGLL